MEISQPFYAKFDHSHSNLVFLLYLIRISLVSADFHPLLCISEESSLPLGICRLSSLVFSWWTDSAPSVCPCVPCSSLCCSLCCSFCLLCWCAAGFTPACQWFFCTGEAPAGNNTWAQSHSCWIEGKIPFSWFTLCAFANTAQFTTDLYQVSTTGSRAAWCLRESSGPFLQSRFLASFHQSVLVCGVSLFRTLYLLLLSFVRFLSTCWGPS